MKEPRVVFGFHAVLARLRSDPSTVLEVYLDEGRNDARGKDLVALAERAVALTHRRDEVALDTLAVAFAETGQFDKAIAAGNDALTVARANRNRSLVPELETRLGMYRAARGR